MPHRHLKTAEVQRAPCRPTRIRRSAAVAVLFTVILALTGQALGQDPAWDLARTIETALAVNLTLQADRHGTAAAEAASDAVRTHFYPTFNAAYAYTRHDDELSSPLFGVITPRHEYSLIGSFSQPVFTGFETLNRFRLARLGVQQSHLESMRTRLDVILDAKSAYYRLLKNQKLAKVADEAVVLLEALAQVARHFYEVGMTPRNDLLKAQVELANTRLAQTVAHNRLTIVQAQFNTLLRRPVDTPVALVDDTAYERFDQSLEAAFEDAARLRPELKLADLAVEAAERKIDLARSDLFPKVKLDGSYYKLGNTWYVDGGPGFSDPDGWELTATAVWEFWQWRRTDYGIAEKQARLRQARLAQDALRDAVRLEVQEAYLRNLEAERNIDTITTAVAQAKENYRITDERYQEQMATATDVLDARTLLSRTQANYFNALYDYKIAQAAMERAMGRETYR